MTSNSLYFIVNWIVFVVSWGWFLVLGGYLAIAKLRCSLAIALHRSLATASILTEPKANEKISRRIYRSVWNPSTSFGMTKWTKIAVFAILAIWFLQAGTKTFLTYFAWKSGEVSQYFLPPWTDIWYFIRYSSYHYFFNFGLTLGVSLFFGVVVLIILKRHQDVKHMETFWLTVFGGLVAKWPYILLYFASIWLILLMAALEKAFRAKLCKLTELSSVTLQPWMIFIAVLAAYFVGVIFYNQLGLITLKV